MVETYKNMQEMKASYNNCTVIKGLKAVEFMEKNDLPVTFNLNATHDFIVISADNDGMVKVEVGMECYNCIIIEEKNYSIDTDYNSFISNMKLKQEMKARKVEKIINDNLVMDIKNGRNYDSKKCEIQEGFFRKEDILKLLALGCKVEDYVIMDNQEYKTVYEKDYVLMETSIYCPTDMRIPSGKFIKKDYGNICGVVYADTWIIRL